MRIIILSWVLTLLLAGQACAGLAGGNTTISGPNCSFPDIAYSPEEDCYLVVWVDYSEPGLPAIFGRLLDVGSDGLSFNPLFRISGQQTRAFFPAVTHNPTAHEFLVTWDHEEPDGTNIRTFGRRIRASDGAPQGDSFQISVTPAGQRSAAAWSTLSQCYLVAYSNFHDVFAQRIDGIGQRVGNELAVNDVSGTAFFPAVSWSPSTDVFLVTWDHAEPGNHDFIRRRLISAAGQFLVDPLTITQGGGEDRSTIARDDVRGRWLVQYNDHSHPGQSYDQYARFIKNDGTLEGEAFAIADGTVFEGDTILGSDIAFAPAAGTYFSSFVIPTGISGQLCGRNGNRLRQQVVLGTFLPPGDFTRHNNAADSLRSQFLTVWEGNPTQSGPTSIWVQLYAVWAPVTDLSAAAGPGRIRLSWTQPADSDMTHVTIRYSTVGPPAGPSDGTLAAKLAVAPGTSASFVHTGLDYTQTYYYAVFAHDSTPIYAPGVTASAQPKVPGDFDDDHDVDQTDFGRLQACFSGDDLDYPEGCADADLDDDGDVDAVDLAMFSACMGGPSNPPGC